MTEQIAEHYERVASTYDEHWTYNPDYVRRFARAMADALRLISSDAIADVGCGTGLYTRQLCEDLAPERPILCVDPVPAMLEQLPPWKGLEPLHASAEDLAAGRVAPSGPLDAVIVKEAIHHVDAREETLRGLAALLSHHGRLLVVMLPRAIEHPLFRAAQERFRERQPEPTEIEAMVAAAGLRTSLSYRTFPVAIERERYIHLLESRYMSVLSEFSADELRAGIEQFKRSYRDPVVRFDDHFAFVKGSVPPG